jgi:hypothetical protein
MATGEFAPNNVSVEPSQEEVRARLVESITEFEQQGTFFDGYVEALRIELAALDQTTQEDDVA